MNRLEKAISEIDPVILATHLKEIDKMKKHHNLEELADVLENYKDRICFESVIQYLSYPKYICILDGFREKENVDVIDYYEQAGYKEKVFRIFESDNRDKAREILDQYKNFQCINNIIEVLFEARTWGTEFLNYSPEIFLREDVKELVKKYESQDIVEVVRWLDIDASIERFQNIKEEDLACVAKICKFIDFNDLLYKALDVIEGSNKSENLTKDIEDLFSSIGPEYSWDNDISFILDLFKEYDDCNMIKAYANIIEKQDDDVTEGVWFNCIQEEAIEAFKSGYSVIAVDHIIYSEKYDNKKWDLRLQRLNENSDLITSEDIASVISKTLGHKTIEFIRKHKGKRNFNKAIDRLNLCILNDKNYYAYLKSFDKYMEIDQVVTLLNNVNGEKYLRELMTDRAYELLSKNPNKLHLITNRDYSDVIEELKKPYADKLSYEELEMVYSLDKMIMAIHKKRHEVTKDIIQFEFYDQMRRAIDQGNSLKEEKQMLKQYCREVRQQMMQRAEELMVIHDD